MTVGCIALGFDSDLDHPLESVLMLNPGTVAPSCVPAVKITDENGRIVREIRVDNLSLAHSVMPQTVQVRSPTPTLPPAWGVPASLFRVSCCEKI